MANENKNAGNKPATQPTKPAPLTDAEKAAKQQEKRDRFVEIAPKRTRGILKAIEVLGNCSNRSGYEYTEADIAKIFGAIQKKLDETKSKFSATKENKEVSFTL